MKILYIVTQADGGGAQKYVLSLAKHFNGAIAAGTEHDALFTAAARLGIQTFPLTHLKRNISLWEDFMAVWQIRQLLNIDKPDIVHLNSSKAGVLGSFAAVGLKTKVVFTAHGFIFNEPLSPAKKAFYISLEKTASAYRDFIITASDTDRTSALENNLIAPEKIQTIHNGIPQINFLPKEEAKQKLGLPLDKKIMGIVANDYPAKGLDLVTKLKPKDGTMIAVIGKINADKKSSANIQFLGPVQDAAIYLKAFDAIMIPSRKEGLPFILPEAMQAGCAIFATDVGGIKDALGGAGEIMKPNDLNELQKVLETSFMDQSKTLEMGKKALARSKMFTEAKMFEQTEAVYKKLLS